MLTRGLEMVEAYVPAADRGGKCWINTVPHGQSGMGAKVNINCLGIEDPVHWIP